MYSILFVCTGNQYRSPIAAEAFRQQLIRDGRDDQWMVGSAGTWTSSGHHAPSNAVMLARSFGLNIDGHITRMVNARLLQDVDLILVMEQGHKESIQVEFPFARKKVFLISQVLDGFVYDIPDPVGVQGEAGNIIKDLVEMIRAKSGNIYRIIESLL